MAVVEVQLLGDHGGVYAPRAGTPETVAAIAAKTVDMFSHTRHDRSQVNQGSSKGCPGHCIPPNNGEEHCVYWQG